MDKLGRNYILTIQGTNFPIPLIITLPFTIEFDITRNTLTSANVCQIRIYNLSPKNRNLIRRNVTGYGDPYQAITLQAGYGTSLPIIFTGNVSQAWSVREGTNFITQIECYDGGFAFVNGQTNLTVPAGFPYQLLIADLIKTLPNVNLGAVGSYIGSSPRANTYNGNTIQILKELTGGGFFIDNGTGNALGNNEYSIGIGSPLVINAAAGLLNTPILEQTIVRFDMIFEPSLNPGNSVILISATEANFNGMYKVTAVKHRGMISQTVCGSAITTGEFFFSKILTPVVTFP